MKLKAKCTCGFEVEFERKLNKDGFYDCFHAACPNDLNMLNVELVTEKETIKEALSGDQTEKSSDQSTPHH